MERLSFFARITNCGMDLTRMIPAKRLAGRVKPG
jgi:hypothetical protein